MLALSILGVACLYAGFVTLDIIAILPRISGSILQKNGIGYSFQVMTNTVKRIFVVLYPPLLGAVAIQGDISDLFKAIAISYALSVLIWLCLYFFRIQIISFFTETLNEFAKSGFIIASIRSGLKNYNKWVAPAQEKLPKTDQRLDRSLVFPAIWIYFFYSSTPFLINLLGAKYDEYSAIILQLTGLSSAFGTLALAFILDPRLARRYEDDNDIATALQSLLISHLVTLAAIGPFFFMTLYILLG